MVVPSGNRLGESFFGERYLDRKGTFYMCALPIVDFIEAMVTRGRGYIDPEADIKKENEVRIPYAEHPDKDNLDPEEFCYERLEFDKFPWFMDDLEEGHPTYSKLYDGLIRLKPFTKIINLRLIPEFIGEKMIPVWVN